MTLVEILEQVIVEHNDEFNKTIRDATDHQIIAHTAVLVGLLASVKVAKQYNEWNSVDDSPPNENEIVLIYKQGFGVIGIAKYSANVFWYFDLNGNKNNFISMSGVTHYKSLPSPPSEVYYENIYD